MANGDANGPDGEITSPYENPYAVGTDRDKAIKAAWETYQGWQQDAQRQYQTGLSTARAEYAMRGGDLESATWAEIEKQHTEKYDAELADIQSGPTYTFLKEEVSRYTNYQSSRNSYISSTINDLRMTVPQSEGGYSQTEWRDNLISGGMSGKDAFEATYPSTPTGKDAFDSQYKAEETGRQITSLQNTRDNESVLYGTALESPEAYLTSVYGTFDADPGQTDEEIAQEAAEGAARGANVFGSTSGAAMAMGVGYDDDEDNKKNIWI